MVRRLTGLLLLFPLLLILGCQPPEKTARDVIAVSKGVIQTAQAKYHDSCVANPTQAVCQNINKTISGQHAAVHALYVYCQFQDSDPPEKVCQPVKALLPGLQSATINLNNLTNDLKGVIQ